MINKEPIAIFWFRRDLRLEDNAGLWHALTSGYPVLPVFIFDKNILDKLDDRSDRRISFISGALQSLQKKIIMAGSTLMVYHDTPENAFRKALEEYNVRAVYTNHDYEPYAIERDGWISDLLRSAGIPLHTFKDQVIFEKDDVVKPDGSPYTVYTPYSRTWKKHLRKEHLTPFPSENLAGNFIRSHPGTIPRPEAPGFRSSPSVFSEPFIDTEIIRNYHLTRDIPSLKGTTRLGAHIRCGTLSIRELVRTALSLNDTWLNELIWREFFMSILWHFPKVTDRSFKIRYDSIAWRNNEEEFEKWCAGRTGYPIVDAGMHELNETGFMHNRVRMITASFLTRHLLTDWRWGEAYFAEKLLDYELSSNNGNWQWAAGSGCDAAPYFRIFNPAEQTRKFDPELKYIKRWVPDFNSPDYPAPVVDHSFARARAIRIYSEGLREG